MKFVEKNWKKFDEDGVLELFFNILHIHGFETDTIFPVYFLSHFPTILIDLFRFVPNVEDFSKDIFDHLFFGFFEFCELDW